MFRIFALLLLTAGCSAYAQTNKKKSSGYNLRIKVPAEWVEKIRNYNYKQNNAPIIREFESFLKPDSLFVPDAAEHIDKSDAGLLSPLFVDLDGDQTSELLCLLGWTENYPSIAVLKKIRSTWYLLYLEDFYMFYTSPDISVANNYSKNKTFYLRKVYDRGSGVYADGYSFYKLIDDKVYPCLDIVNDAHIVGWGLNLNQTVSSKFRFDNNTTDALWVTYNYNFFAGPNNQGDCNWCANEDIPLVRGTKGVNYLWDDKHHIYKREMLKYRTSLEDLSDQKIACFSDMGNDKLFTKAFKDEINVALKNGTRERRKVLKKFLAIVRQKAVRETSKMGIKDKMGGTAFHRLKSHKKSAISK